MERPGHREWPFFQDSESPRGSMSEGVSTAEPWGSPPSTVLLLHHLLCPQLGALTPTTSLWSLTPSKERRLNSDLGQRRARSGLFPPFPESSLPRRALSAWSLKRSRSSVPSWSG